MVTEGAEIPGDDLDPVLLSEEAAFPVRIRSSSAATDNPEQEETMQISRATVLLAVGSLLWTFAVTTGEARGQTGGTTATCGPTTLDRESAILGEFTADGKRTRLFLTYDCRIRHEDGPESELLEAPDSASFKTVCRDPVPRPRLQRLNHGCPCLVRMPELRRIVRPAPVSLLLRGERDILSLRRRLQHSG